ncbi:uncharacterized protein V1510DRAFT_387831 [Dipodascopsis tothii]|uniref:uncharacterized protein n=1 Tax=Dipodascopsis tothii TaxID=44089 RepID=UPI0034CE31E7
MLHRFDHEQEAVDRNHRYANERPAAETGGGISGLATAYYLARRAPGVPVTIYEASNRVGGWIRSERRPAGDQAVLFERGPRTIRHNMSTPSLNTLDMVRGPADALTQILDLGLEDELLTSSKHSDAARNRFIYYGGRLNRLPTTVAGAAAAVLTRPIFRGVVAEAAREPFRARGSGADESVGSFFRRRFGDRVADRFVAAMVHGIYAGDADKLSVQSLFPMLPGIERGAGSLVRAGAARLLPSGRKAAAAAAAAAAARRPKAATAVDAQIRQAVAGSVDRYSDVSVYSFRDGLETLPRALAARVARDGTRILTETPVRSVEIVPGSDGGAYVTTPTGVRFHSHIISAVPARVLAGMSLGIRGRVDDPLGDLADELDQIPAISANVVNLFYSGDELPVRGFGYLLPRLAAEANPEQALGVVFDSTAIEAQDAGPGTKLTVMLGGHLWADGGEVRDTATAVARARAVVARHLGITAEPLAAEATFQEQCIPQYVVGHGARLDRMRAKVAATNGRLVLVGASYRGVAINSCMLTARAVVEDFVNGRPVTGLEPYGL